MTLTELYELTDSPISVTSVNTREKLVFRFSPFTHPEYKDLEVEKITSSYDSAENEDETMQVIVDKIVALVDYDEKEPEIDAHLMLLKICSEAECTAEEISKLLGEN